MVSDAQADLVKALHAIVSACDHVPGAGFYEYYQIDLQHEDYGEESEPGHSGESRGTTSGLNSPWGMIYTIVKDPGWTWHYVLWRVAWINVQMMLADAPRRSEVPT